MPTIQKLIPDDASVLSELLKKQSSQYRKSFFPFADESEKALFKLLLNCSRDCYWGIWHKTQIVGFFMLRGWDLGFDIPSFGVLVDEKQRRKGLATLALLTAISYCRLENVPELMLKVDPVNESAYKIYEAFKFKKTGICSQHGHVTMNLKLEH